MSKRSFGERMGKVTRPTTIQLDEINDALRTRHWNFFHMMFENGMNAWPAVCRQLSRNVFNAPVDQAPDADSARDVFKSMVMTSPWWEVYEVLEYVLTDLLPGSVWESSGPALIAKANEILEREVSGYRFINGEIAPIADPIEVQAIEEAAELASAVGLDGVRTHLDSALAALSQKPNR